MPVVVEEFAFLYGKLINLSRECDLLDSLSEKMRLETRRVIGDRLEGLFSHFGI